MNLLRENPPYTFITLDHNNPTRPCTLRFGGSGKTSRPSADNGYIY
jgi:hypothetical protein